MKSRYHPASVQGMQDAECYGKVKRMTVQPPQPTKVDVKGITSLLLMSK